MRIVIIIFSGIARRPPLLLNEHLLTIELIDPARWLHFDSIITSCLSVWRFLSYWRWVVFKCPPLVQYILVLLLQIKACILSKILRFSFVMGTLPLLWEVLVFVDNSQFMIVLLPWISITIVLEVIAVHWGGTVVNIRVFLRELETAGWWFLHGLRMIVWLMSAKWVQLWWWKLWLWWVYMHVHYSF
jgi:hypothetical protein